MSTGSSVHSYKERPGTAQGTLGGRVERGKRVERGEMGDEFQGGVCGGSWWSLGRSAMDDGSSSCSGTQNDKPICNNLRQTDSGGSGETETNLNFIGFYHGQEDGSRNFLGFYQGQNDGIFPATPAMIPAGLRGTPVTGHASFRSPSSLSERALSPHPNPEFRTEFAGEVGKRRADLDIPAKRHRVESPSPVQSFKGRKEKMGDRVTALQQLVSPFGKTDTASVLHEAIECIKFLHEQISALSSPYIKNGSHHLLHSNSGLTNVEEDSGKDLRSRGLCLVPISIMHPISDDMSPDFWTPFAGSLR